MKEVEEVHADGSVSTSIQPYTKEANSKILAEQRKRQTAKMKGYEETRAKSVVRGPL